MGNLYTRRKFTSPVDKDAVARDWRQQGYSCDWFVDPPGREWNDFVHRCNELDHIDDLLLRVERHLGLKV